MILLYMPSPYNEHMTSFYGNGKVITRIALEQLAGQAGFSGIAPLINMLEEIYNETRYFRSIASELKIDKPLVMVIEQHMEQKWSDIKNIIK